MTGTISCRYDTAEFSRLAGALTGALLGSGASPGDCQDVLKTEAAILAWEISDQLGPKSLDRGKKLLDADLRAVFFPLDTRVAAAFADRPGNQGDFLWLFAYKNQNGSSLVGADLKDIAGPGVDLRAAFYNQSNRKRGNAWVNVTGSGDLRNPRAWRDSRPQHAYKLNRIIVTPAAYKALGDPLRAKIGQLRAAFARAAVALGSKRRIPAFVAAQIEQVISLGKSIFDDSQINDPASPSITFGARAKGVATTPKVAAKIGKAVERRRFLMKAKIQKVLEGYAYQFKTGQIYKQPVITQAEES